MPSPLARTRGGMWRTPDRRTLMHGAAGIAAALAGGALFYRLDVPLAWVLGPLLATAILSMAGLKVLASTPARRFGQLVIGTGLGLGLTKGMLIGVLAWLPLMLLSAMSAILLTAFLSVFLARLGEIDRVTAYFALMPGGLSEMANIGAEAGARSEPIALAQAIRLGLVVCVLPPAIIGLGISGDFLRIDPTQALPPGPVAALIIAGFAGVWLMARIGTNNPWMLGGLFTGAAAASFGLLDGQMPRLVFYTGQFLLGVAIGARFRRDIVARLPGLSLLMAAFTLGITVILFGFGWILARVTGIDLATAALATSAGGVVEMSLTAQILQLNLALVLGFHVTRAVLVNGFCIHIRDALERAGFFAAAERLAAVTLGLR